MNGRWNFSMLQLLLLTALCALAAGLVASAAQQARLHYLQQLLFSPDGRWLAACDVTGDVLVWDLHRRRPVARRSGLSDHSPNLTPAANRFVDEDLLSAVLLAPDGVGAELILWDVARDQQAKRLPLRSYPVNHAVSATGQLCAVDFSGRSPGRPGGKAVAGEIGLWDITSGRKLQSLILEADYDQLWFSADGSALVAAGAGVDGGLLVQIWDTATGTCRRVKLEPTEAHWAGESMALSRDARLLAVGCAGDAMRIELWDLNQAQRVAVCAGGPMVYVTCLAFSPDGRGLVSCTYGGDVRIWDVSTSVLAAAGPRQLPRTFGFGSLAAFSPDGRTLATASETAISLWDAKTLEHRRDLYRDNRFLTGLVYSLGFAGWAVVWGLVARGRAGPPGCEAPDPSHRGLPRAVQAGLNPRRVWSRFLLLTLLTGVLCAWVLADAPAWGWNWTYPARFAAVVLFTMLGLMLLLLAIAFLPGSVRRWRGVPYRRGLRRAARIAGSADCRVHCVGPVTAAFLGRCHLSATFAEDYEVARQQIAELLGQPLDPQRPLTVLVFERREWFDAYLDGHLPLAGVYWMGLDRQLMICEEACLRGLTEPRRIWQLLLTRYLFEQGKGFHPTAGLAMILGGHLNAQGDESLSHRVHRRLQVARRRGDMPLPDDPLLMTDRELSRAILQGSPRERSRMLVGVQAQCYSLAEYLLGPQAGPRREAFTRFLKELKSARDDLPPLLASHLGDPDAFRAAWLEWVATRPTEPAGQSEPIVGAFARRVLLPLIRDERAEAEQRAEAIRSLGSAGYEIGVELLIDLLQKSPRDLREDAAWALESITGCSHGEDAAAWQQWWVQRQETADPREASLPDSADVVYTAELADGGVVAAELVDAVRTRGIGSASEPPDLVAPNPLTAEAAESGRDARRLKVIWSLLGLGGLLSVVVSVEWAMYLGPSFLPATLPGALSGVYAITRAAGHQTRGVRPAIRLLMLNLALGNVPSAVIGLVAAFQARGARL